MRYLPMSTFRLIGRNMSTPDTTPLPSTIDPLLTDKQIAAALNVCVETIERERKAGRMPPIVRVTARKHGTRVSVFQQWLTEREAK